VFCILCTFYWLLSLLHRICNCRCLSVCSLATLRKNFKRICMKFLGKVSNGPVNKWLNFGADPDHRLDTGIVFRIVRRWKIRKMISTDCTARWCIAGHALAGIAIATMMSLCHRPTRDSRTDIATLVRRALAEVCTVPVLPFVSLVVNTNAINCLERLASRMTCCESRRTVNSSHCHSVRWLVGV